MSGANNLFLDIFRQAPYGVWIIDDGGKTEAVNPAMAALLGYCVSEMERAGPETFFEEAGKLAEFRAGLVSGGRGEIALTGKNGKPHTLDFTAARLPGWSGWILYFLKDRPVTCGLDIVDAAGLVADSIRDLFCVLDLNGRLIKCNSALHRLTGYGNAEVAGMRPTDFFRPSDAPRIMETLDKVWREGTATLEAELKTKKGEFVPMEYALSRITGAGGETLGCSVVGRDLTEYREAQKRTLALLAENHVPELPSSPDRELGDIIDVPAMQSLLNDFASLTGLNASILDEHNGIVVAAGWRDICAKYHRINPETASDCLACNEQLAAMIKPGEYASLKCERGLWNVATPLYIEGAYKGMIVTSQFFLDDEKPDPENYGRAAGRFGFDRAGYLKALAGVPHVSSGRVKTAMDFLIKLSALVSRLSFSNTRLSRMMIEQKRTELALRESSH
ncbi:MAG: PocR ligand-binding domain-containing protein [Elusimicrobiaceae bacterium]|nr:PocR ligand-binding domain-containing protein [Elusimicrobiaceae bacterium]